MKKALGLIIAIIAVFFSPAFAQEAEDGFTFAGIPWGSGIDDVKNILEDLSLIHI